MSIKAGYYLEAVFWLGILILTQISRSRFKQSRISPLILHIHVLGCFVNLLVSFLVYLEIDSFSQWISSIYEIGSFEDLVLF